MTIYEEMKGYLERMPKARERKNKNRFLATLMVRKYGSQMQTGMDADVIERLIVSASTYDRAWRQVLEHEPSLRGSDYDDKVVLEQEKELELGYQPGIKKDIKKVAEITKPYKE